MDSLINDVIQKNGGNVPKSDDEGAFANYTSDGVPRPDCPLNTLRMVSLLGGILGADYFYLGSIKNGFLKLLPALITGILTIIVPFFAPIAATGSFYIAIPFMALWLIWYIWDVTQVFFESDFVLKFGMSTLFNMGTGIGQGRVTDRPTVYETKGNFGIWALLTLLLWPTGLHNLVFKNVGAFMLQALTLAACAGLAYYAYGYYQDSDMFDTILYGLPALFIGCIIMFGWGSTAYQIVTKGTGVIRDGLQMDIKTDKIINGAIEPLVDSNNAIPSIEKPSVKNDTYITPSTPEQMQQEFQSRHPSEPKPTEKEVSGSFKSLFMMLSGIIVIPAQILYYAIRELIMGIYYIFFPEAAITNTVIDGVRDAVKTGMTTDPAAAMELAQDIENSNFKEAGKLIEQIQHPYNQRTPQQYTGSQYTPQIGSGRPESLSVESLVLGATALALIVGGAIKGSIDHLFVGL
jgi:hypothetical protein